LEQEFPNPLAFLCFRRDDPSCSGLAPFVPAALATSPPEYRFLNAKYVGNNRSSEVQPLEPYLIA
jgi:hypothetical protein